MESGDDIIKKLQIELERIADQFKLRSLSAFGSVCTPQFNANSDVDLLVSFEDTIDLEDYADNFFDLNEELERILNRNIDLVVDKSLKNPYLIKSIEGSKVLLYG